MSVPYFAYIIGGLWIVTAIFDYAYFTYFAQLKEYRFDRFRDFLTTQAGKEELFGYRILWRALLVIVLYTLLHGTLSNMLLVSCIIGIDIIAKIYCIWRKSIRRPVPTPKALLIVGMLVGMEGMMLFFLPYINILLLVLVFRWFLTAGVVLILSIPSFLAKKMYIMIATKKIARYKKLRVIGITGSYGKSSTKEFLSQILETRYAIKKTPKNTNTEIGIAKHILKTDFAGVDVYVVEMGAYRMKEIKKICDIVHPQIGILTAIAPQHLSLFGSMENIAATKKELLTSLPKNGWAITNIDNAYCREIISNLSCHIRTFGSDEEYKPDILIRDIENIENGITYRVSDDTMDHIVRLNILGKHNVFNIVPAAIAAHRIGMSDEDIDMAIEKLTPGHGSITISPYGTATIINDSYNSNPEGFKAALDILNSFSSSRKRIVITRGMRELGDLSDELHEQIGGEISFVADELIITEKDVAASLAKGVVSKYNTHIQHIYDPHELLKYVQGLKHTDAVVLIENRLHIMIAKELDIALTA
ncbi:MAG: UDP-N-acetylmuramoyl-tripeptide-D-alanyl-D-alanine ligase [Candidatus Magasanikbacteria bacterium GW2011_GWE2_42_7]|uniref:UDP-N-acetylmuramoyl-tripeptide-D-alanyl-D-alanine ligase n=1 Tax=Candidatus Magasanikbacteria bacterium GW2011_GWE2_42_7 TaxID=1619052 RepID=A0A0G1EET5_9BACT|nr:MAG: UDP-N-acetylmuramoyl-tripeptide-D-alanyl-D-alanine ligase [Candidatus Magasanikbacteria bacterium GW2011_GWE2_42_7]